MHDVNGRHDFSPSGAMSDALRIYYTSLPCYLRLLWPAVYCTIEATGLLASITSSSYVGKIPCMPRAIKSCLPCVYTWHHQVICRYIECVTSCKRKNRFESRCEGWQWCGLWRESCLVYQSFNSGVSAPYRCFLWPLYYIGLYYLYYAGPLFRILGCNYLRESFNSHLWV